MRRRILWKGDVVNVQGDRAVLRCQSCGNGRLLSVFVDPDGDIHREFRLGPCRCGGGAAVTYAPIMLMERPLSIAVTYNCPPPPGAQ